MLTLTLGLGLIVNQPYTFCATQKKANVMELVERVLTPIPIHMGITDVAWIQFGESTRHNSRLR
jgi:hypothetical protein